jgi:excisionase family DNA binding protein
MIGKRQSNREVGRLPSFLTVQDVAELLGMSIKTVRRMMAAGELPFYRFGRSIRIAEIDLINLAKIKRSV